MPPARGALPPFSPIARIGSPPPRRRSQTMLALLFAVDAALVGPSLRASQRTKAVQRSEYVQNAYSDDIAAMHTDVLSMEAGMKRFADDFPWLAKYGFGPSVKAERWNGRHAMFGWFFILLTGFADAHGLIPNAGTPLKYAEWGALTQLGFNEYISNQRAIIMIAHIHALAVSAAAAFGPQVLGDTLTLLDGEEDEEPYGLFPPLMGQGGLTPAAEMWNGRLAMLGLIAVVMTSLATGKDILEVIDIGTGGLLYAAKNAPAAVAPVVEAAADAAAAAAPAA